MLLFTADLYMMYEEVSKRLLFYWIRAIVNGYIYHIYAIMLLTFNSGCIITYKTTIERSLSYQPLFIITIKKSRKTRVSDIERISDVEKPGDTRSPETVTWNPWHGFHKTKSFRQTGLFHLCQYVEYYVLNKHYKVTV